MILHIKSYRLQFIKRAAEIFSAARFNKMLLPTEIENAKAV